MTGDPRLPDTHTSFAEYIFVTNISQKNLIDGQELPTNVIVCRHRYYVKAKNFTFPYRCNQCRCGIISPKIPTDVLRGWKLYRIGAQNVDGRTIAKFSMKNPETKEPQKEKTAGEITVINHP